MKKILLIAMTIILSTIHAMAQPTNDKKWTGFKQYIHTVPISCNMHISYRMPPTNSFAVSTHLNYIAGYRFNKNVFMGVGTGINLNWMKNLYHKHSINVSKYHSVSSGNDIADASLTLFSIPIYIHFRTDFGQRTKKWNPYLAISLGGQFSIGEPYKHFSKQYFGGINREKLSPIYTLRNRLLDHSSSNKEFLGDINIGANRKLTEKIFLYIGLGYKLGCRNSLEIRTYESSSYQDVWGGVETRGIHSLELIVGISF